MTQKDNYLLTETSPFIIKPCQELRFDLNLKPVPKPAGSIQGWIRPLVRTCVKAFDLHLNPVEHTYTDSHGRYKLSLPSGIYYIGAVAPGYQLSPLVKMRIVPTSCQEVNFWLTRIKLSENPFESH